jgi:hypothetical protein
MATRRPRQTFQLKIGLKGTKPPIWRRVLVPSDIRLDQLHILIQMAMGWLNCHLHQFIAYGAFFGTPDDEFGMDIQDETKIKLHDLLEMEKDSMIYEYDFGDGWEHKITLEKVLPYDKSQALPVCIKGKRACPPEDCGGVWGYEGLLKALADPADPEHEDMLEWLGGTFDAEEFDINAVNFALSAQRKSER